MVLTLLLVWWFFVFGQNLHYQPIIFIILMIVNTVIWWGLFHHHQQQQHRNNHYFVRFVSTIIIIIIASIITPWGLFQLSSSLSSLYCWVCSKYYQRQHKKRPFHKCFSPEFCQKNRIKFYFSVSPAFVHSFIWIFSIFPTLFRFSSFFRWVGGSTYLFVYSLFFTSFFTWHSLFYLIFLSHFISFFICIFPFLRPICCICCICCYFVHFFVRPPPLTFLNSPFSDVIKFSELSKTKTSKRKGK